MARIVAIANIKGGVGKTTTAVNLATALLERGHRVLALDLDPQSSLTISVGFNPDKLSPTIRDVLSGAYIYTAILTTAEAWHLIPSNEKLGDFETGADREQIFALTSALEGVRPVYDFILLDCPAGAGVLTGMALLSADEVVIPLTPDFLSYRSLASLMRIIQALRQRFNPKLRVAGLFLAMYDSRTRHARDILTALHNTYNGEIPFFSAVVHNSVRLKEAPVVGQSVLKYAPQSQAAQAFRRIATELDQGLPQAAAGKEARTTVADREPVPTIVQVVSGHEEGAATPTPRPAQAEFILNSYAPGAPRARENDKPVDVQTVPTQINWSEPRWGEKGTLLDFEFEAAIRNASAASITQLLELGQRLGKMGQQQRAAQVFERITELDPRNAVAWLGRATTTGNLHERLEFIHRSLEIHPDDPAAKAALLVARKELQTGAARVVREFRRRQRAGKAEDARSLFKQADEHGLKAPSRRRATLALLALCLARIVELLILLLWLPRR
jgi:chromosome partitioning protein